MAPENSPPDWNANLYERSHSFVWKFGGPVLELLSPQPGERILDLGCGTGQLTAQIAETGAEVLGIDRSAEMLGQARANFPQIRFELADARDFSVAPSDFDAVFSNAVLHWVKPPVAAVLRIHAALKSGGRFVAEFGGSGNNRLMLASFRRQLAILGVGDFEVPWYFPGIAEYAGLLESHGFEVTLASLHDRPTPLEGDEGLRNWFEMFLKNQLEQFSATERAHLLSAVEEDLRPSLYRNNVWQADYRRLRIVARRLT